MAHIGVLRVFEQEGIPIHSIAGVSAGSMVAAAYASGASPDEIEIIARAMKFRDVASWTISRLGFARSERMTPFLQRLLKVHTFEQMRLPLAVVATSLNRGKPVVFRDRGDVLFPIRASCSYPGLFEPLRHGKEFLVDGGVSMEVPAPAVRQLGATHVIAVLIPSPETSLDPSNVFSVVQRCFQIMTSRTEHEWRRSSALVLQPAVADLTWDSFASSAGMIRAGEAAARAALPRLRQWLRTAAAPLPAPR
jgi:NTE family protein